MITKQIKFFISILFLVFTLCLCNIVCNSISNERQLVQSSFIQPEKEKYDREDTIIIFNTRRNHEISLSGIRSTEYWHSTTKTVFRSDSIYGKIITQGEEILIINDSAYGGAQFVTFDIANWAPLVTFIRDTNCLLGQLLYKNLSKSEVKSIIACTLSIDLLTDTLKNSILNVFKNFMSSYDFYYLHKAVIDSEISPITSLLDTFTNELNILQTKYKIIDSKGKVIKNESSLSKTELEKLKWFQKNIITNYLGNANIIPGNDPVFKKYPTKGKIFSFSFQLHTDKNRLNENNLIRYFEINNSVLSQIGFRTPISNFLLSNNTIATNSFEKIGNWKVINAGTMVHKHPCKTIDSWVATPLFWNPSTPFLSKDDIYSILLPGHGTVELVKYSSVSLDTMWFDMKFYYSLGGTIVKKNTQLYVSGSILLTLGYLKTVDTPEFGIFTHWKTDYNIQARDNNNELQKFSEKISMQCQE